MNEQEKQQYLQDRMDEIKGAEIIDLKVEIQGEVVVLKEVKLRQKNGNEFILYPEGIGIKQVLWG